MLSLRLWIGGKIFNVQQLNVLAMIFCMCTRKTNKETNTKTPPLYVCSLGKYLFSYHYMLQLQFYKLYILWISKLDFFTQEFYT